MSACSASSGPAVYTSLKSPTGSNRPVGRYELGAATGLGTLGGGAEGGQHSVSSGRQLGKDRQATSGTGREAPGRHSRGRPPCCEGDGRGQPGRCGPQAQPRRCEEPHAAQKAHTSRSAAVQSGTHSAVTCCCVVVVEWTAVRTRGDSAASWLRRPRDVMSQPGESGSFTHKGRLTLGGPTFHSCWLADATTKRGEPFWDSGVEFDDSRIVRV